MQIKRFEAADMTEALRLVKREFGDDAVILSAKEVRPRGFFSALRKKSVEITAAADYPNDESRETAAFPGLLAQQLDTESENDRVSLSAASATIKPFVPQTNPAFHPTPIRKNRRMFTETKDLAIQRQPISDCSDMSPDNTVSKTSGAAANTDTTAIATGRQPPETTALIEKPFYQADSGQSIIALVGPSGAGKSATVAKLARHCVAVEKKRTGLISLDRFRIGANGMLAAVARLMNLPLAIVYDADQLQTAIKDLAEADVVMIDTPGMGASDSSLMAEVGSLLGKAHADEIHLVVNATVRDEVLAATAKTFLPVGVNRLLLTHMDEIENSGAVLKLQEKINLPLSFFGDGVDLFTNLQQASLDRLNSYCGNVQCAGHRVTAFPGKTDRLNVQATGHRDTSGSEKYVANCNSELFHHLTCKSVKRINAENIAAFDSIEQALSNGFKPCRACCSIGRLRKPIASTFGYQRASAI